MPLRKWIKSANFAIEGILHAAKTQRHMRYHLYASVLILLLSFSLGIGWIEFIALVVLSIIVISVEMINTAIESIADVLFKEYDPRAKAIKDISAGAVLITAIGAVVIGYKYSLSHSRICFIPALPSQNIRRGTWQLLH